MKTCTKCKLPKDESKFSFRCDRPLKLYSHCKECHTARTTAQYHANKNRTPKEVELLRAVRKSKRLSLTKSCPRCGIEKPKSEFYAKAGKPGETRCWCKSCSVVAGTESNRKRRNKDPEGHLKQIRNLKLQYDYGITLEDRNRMFIAQGGACAVCKERLLEQGRKGLHVDHDHKTGKVRGLLCPNCNYAIGHMRDSSVIARAVAEYLDKSSAPPLTN